MFWENDKAEKFLWKIEFELSNNIEQQKQA